MPIAAKQSTLHATRSRPSAARVSAIDPLLFLLAMAGQLGQPRSTRLHWRYGAGQGSSIARYNMRLPRLPQRSGPRIQRGVIHALGPHFPPAPVAYHVLYGLVYRRILFIMLEPVGLFFFVSFSMLFDVYF
ncbi:hypothetical protein [Oryza sativa Japonica Group]|uniref:Uncharacterized protein n=2 Tax=Oryza sativa subsp. japonica TaxID=39947 RepID=Q5VQT8_ORYSJ|nr:hypothetical protein [Oryza sativa Japonica Group]BAD68322.1 hypothetical protein [Oryza sativa Japonica Group]